MHGGENYITVLGRYLAFALVFFSVTAFGDGFLDDDLDYSFEYGSATQVYVTGMSMYTSATNITIPATVVYEYLDSDENGNAHIKHRDCIVVRIGIYGIDNVNGNMLPHILLPAEVTLLSGIPGLGGKETRHRQQTQAAPYTAHLLGKFQNRVILVGNVAYRHIKLHCQ